MEPNKQVAHLEVAWNILPDMLNLLGCNKENFIKLINHMGYKSFKKNNDTFFKYTSQNKIYKKGCGGNVYVQASMSKFLLQMLKVFALALLQAKCSLHDWYMIPDYKGHFYMWNWENK